MSGRILCAWHFINWGREFDMGEARTEGDTHSICPSCTKVLQDCSNMKTDALKAARTSSRLSPAPDAGIAPVPAGKDQR